MFVMPCVSRFPFGVCFEYIKELLCWLTASCLRPGMLDFKGKAKWDSWNTKKGLGQEDAKQQYVALAAKLKEKHGAKA